MSQEAHRNLNTDIPPWKRRGKNCALSALFETAQSFELAPSVDSSLKKSEEHPLTAFPHTSKFSRSPLLDVNRNVTSFHTLLDDSKVLRPVRESLPSETRKATYHLREIARVSHKGQADSTCSLLNDLSLALSSFNTKIQLSKINRQFDLLIKVEKLELIAPHEILVTTGNANKIKRSIILHSNKPLQESIISRFSFLKLAINSKCYLELCNGIIWYLRWKFF